jgi:hypothetical protein
MKLSILRARAKAKARASLFKLTKLGFNLLKALQA